MGQLIYSYDDPTWNYFVKEKSPHDPCFIREQIFLLNPYGGRGDLGGRGEGRGGRRGAVEGGGRKWENGRGAKRRREEGGKGREGETPTPYPPPHQC